METCSKSERLATVKVTDDWAQYCGCVWVFDIHGVGLPGWWRRTLWCIAFLSIAQRRKSAAMLQHKTSACGSDRNVVAFPVNSKLVLIGKTQQVGAMIMYRIKREECGLRRRCVFPVFWLMMPVHRRDCSYSANSFFSFIDARVLRCMTVNKSFRTAVFM